jgi:hypothetical protein
LLKIFINGQGIVSLFLRKIDKMKHLYKVLFSLFLVFAIAPVYGQNYSLPKATLNVSGNPGMFMLADLKVENISAGPIQILVNRFYQNYPSNGWFTCYCYLFCHAPAQDTLYINLSPGETAIVTLGFTTDTVPGIGYNKVTVEEVGNSAAKDTLTFSCTTVAAGIHEYGINRSFRFYPNPSIDKVVLTTAISEAYSIRLTDIKGKTVQQQSDINSKQYILNVENIPVGEYFLNVQYKSGKTETQKLIKN